MPARHINNMVSTLLQGKVTVCSNNYAVSSKDLGAMLEDSASALVAGGNSIDETIALLTSMNEILQDSSKSSTALRTIAMRLRNTSVDLQAMGEDSDGAAESVSALRDEIKAVSGVDIMLDEDTYKSTYQILNELSFVWSDLTDKEQAGLTKLIAGNKTPYVYRNMH